MFKKISQFFRPPIGHDSSQVLSAVAARLPSAASEVLRLQIGAVTESRRDVEKNHVFFVLSLPPEYPRFDVEDQDGNPSVLAEVTMVMYPGEAHRFKVWTLGGVLSSLEPLGLVDRVEGSLPVYTVVDFVDRSHNQSN